LKLIHFQEIFSKNLNWYFDIFLSTKKKKKRLEEYSNRKLNEYDQEDIFTRYILSKVSGKKTMKPKSINQQVKNLQIWYHNEMNIKINLNKPLGQIYAIDWVISKLCVLRNDENYKIYLEDFEIIDKDKRKWYEITSKTRNALKMLKKANLFKSTTIKRNNEDPLDLINMLEAFIKHRPEDFKTVGPLYLHPLQDFEIKNEVFFSNVPMEYEDVRKLIETYSVESCGNRYTSHSKKKSSINILHKNNVDDSTLMKVSGNSKTSLDNYYKTTTDEKYSKVQEILTQHKFNEVISTSTIEKQKIFEDSKPTIEESLKKIILPNDFLSKLHHQQFSFE
jgi:hypothetical protein